MKLDRGRKYGTVYGSSKEKYYQDGCFFDGTGKFVRAAAGKAPPVPTTEPITVVETDDGMAKRMADFANMSLPALRELVGKVEAATGVASPEGGKGAKARYVKYLADNTTD